MANGTIAFDTLQTSGQISSTAKSVDTDYIARGCGKCFMDLNGAGTIALRDSFNISSVADNGTGLYTVSINNDFDSVNYVYAGGAETSSDGQNGRGITGVSTQILTGSSKIFSCTLSSNSAEDLDHIRVGWWGDLA
jgi:hypothetical protein